MKSLKKFFALCLTLALVLSLAACGKKEEGPSAPDDPAVETTDVPRRFHRTLQNRRAQRADRHGPCQADAGQ